MIDVYRERREALTRAVIDLLYNERASVGTMTIVIAEAIRNVANTYHGRGEQKAADYYDQAAQKIESIDIE